MSLSEYDWANPEEFSDFTTLNNETLELPASKPYLKVEVDFTDDSFTGMSSGELISSTTFVIEASWTDGAGVPRLVRTYHVIRVINCGTGCSECYFVPTPVEGTN